MPKNIRLTPAQVQSFKEGDLSDGRGLLLRVRPPSASWVFRYTAPGGRRREMGLGVCHRATESEAGQSLEAARSLAQRSRELLASGKDPIDARAAQREKSGRAAEKTIAAAKARSYWTLARCARDYHERVIEPTRTSKHSAQWIASLENHMPAWIWGKPICDISPADLLRAIDSAAPDANARHHAGLRETKLRIQQRLRVVFEDAVFFKRCAENVAEPVRQKLVEGKVLPEENHHRALPFGELPAFMRQLREANGTAARALEFAVLTAARTTEALCATWAEFDLDAATWLVPAERMKGKKAHRVHLSTQAVAVLRGQLGQHALWVFPSPTKTDAPLSGMAMLTVLDRMGMRERTTVHGLCRATFSTWANETNQARPEVVEACLAHANGSKFDRAYNRAAYIEERAALLDRWGDFVSGSA